MRRTLAAAAGAVLAAAVLSGTGLAAASASPAATGTEHFQIMTTSATAHRTGIIVTGVFTAGGVDHEGRSVATETFPGGTFTIRHSRGTGKQTFNPRTCLLTLNVHGTYTLSHGTGTYASISGHGTYQLRVLAIAQRAHGKCSQSLPPASFQQIISGSGPVSLP
jgi:hypothetical protein